MRRPLVFALAVSTLAGCSLFVSLSDLSGGNTNGNDGSAGDTATSDVSSGNEASIDGSPSYASEVMSDNPIAYWRLGDVGNTAVDETANHLDGTYSASVSPTTGLLVGDSNGAALFAGSDDGGVQLGILVPQNALLEPKAAISIEAWVKPLQIRSMEFASYGAQTFAPYQPWAFQIDKGSPTAPNGSFTNFFYTSNAGGDYGSKALDAGTIYHFVATFDGVTLRTYTDGLLDHAIPATGILAYDDAGLGLALGSGTLGEYPVIGVLDEVAVYDHELDAGRVAAHYQAGTN